MVGLNKAMEKARAAIESMYDGKATISEYKPVKDPVTKRTTSQEVEIIKDQMCRLIFKSIPMANQTDTGASLSQVIKLLIAPELNIKPGSKIVVTQQGRMVAYKNSGMPAVYRTHQEITLELFKGWT